MKDIQEIWNEIPEKSLKEDEISDLLSRKSVFEVDKFKRLLLIELCISWVLAIVVFFTHETVGMEMAALIYITVFLGSLLNIVTLRKIKKLQLLDDLRSFIKSTLKVLKTFVTGFILSIQIIGVFMITALKFLKKGPTSWLEWFTSEQGVLTIAVFSIIEVILISYAWVFYIKRIRSLKKILDEMDT